MQVGWKQKSVRMLVIQVIWGWWIAVGKSNVDSKLIYPLVCVDIIWIGADSESGVCSNHIDHGVFIG